MKKTSVSAKYYLTGLLLIMVLPAILVALYEWLAGGVLNGIAGSWRQAIINPDVFLLFVNPVTMLSGYALLIYFFREYKKQDKSILSTILAYSIFILATSIVVIGVFWKALTT